MQYRLGIDLGTNSIGWAAVRLNENGEACGVLNMGVRIFPDGREKSRSDDPLGPSRAESRRVPRGQRRRRDGGRVPEDALPRSGPHGPCRLPRGDSLQSGADGEADDC